MIDVFSKEKRSEIMSKIRSRHTKPEMKVRKWLHKQGFRFRLYKKGLPGNPDIVLPKHKTVIFVHGCFWHRHPGCKRASMPASNIETWQRKFERNVIRDKRSQEALRELGWRTIIIWQCEVADESYKEKILSLLLGGT
ncbi:MAG: DNA mismatch endonuclease Vsr [Candidatus Methanomethyliaceae archaeon]